MTHDQRYLLALGCWGAICFFSGCLIGKIVRSRR